jgi:hypothetical protein
MTTLREAAQQALEAMLSWQERIEREWGCGYSNEKLDALGMTDPAITALRAALEQPEQEPVANSFTMDELTEAAVYAEIPDGPFQSLLIGLQEAIKQRAALKEHNHE